jgi:Na+/melibiose symporter-like transporter
MIAVLAYAVIAVVFSAFAEIERFSATLALFFILGAPFAGMQLLPFTMLAHLAHASGRRGIRSEALYTGVWTAGEKLSLAIGPAAAGVGLALVGYVSGDDAQSSDTVNGVRWLMALGPAVFLVPAAFLFGTRRPVG